MRGRGLKLSVIYPLPPLEASPLMRGRGLKRVYLVSHSEHYTVAPYAGAWIETAKGGS